MNKFFKSKFAKTSTKTAEPREMTEINKSYSSLCAQAGQLETAIRLNKKQLEGVYAALENINSEANARQELDKASQKPAETTTGEANV